MSRFDSTDRVFLYVCSGVFVLFLVIAVGMAHSEYRASQSFIACIEAGNSPAECEVVK